MKKKILILTAFALMSISMQSFTFNSLTKAPLQKVKVIADNPPYNAYVVRDGNTYWFQIDFNTNTVIAAEVVDATDHPYVVTQVTGRVTQSQGVYTITSRLTWITSSNIEQTDRIYGTLNVSLVD